MECSRIHKQLQSFLGDLLSEEEYRLFLEHLDGCARCKPYVRSIGDLSNQIWKLGDVVVPADFRATVLFEVDHPASPAAPESPKSSAGGGLKKYYGPAGVVLILLLAALFMKTGPRKSEPSVRVPDRSLADASAKAPADAALASSIQPQPPAVVPAALPAAVLPERPAVSAEPKSPPAALQPLHWHLTYSSDADHRAEAEKRKQGLLQLQTLRAKAESLKTQINLLEEEKQHDLGQAYSDEDMKAKTAGKAERDAALATLVQEIPQLDVEIKRTEDENAGVERKWLEESAEKKRRDTQIRAKILDTLVVFDAKFQYQTEGFIVFSVASEKLDHVLENILPIFQQAGEFQDFGGGPPGAAGQEQRVSVYLDREGVSDLHWHVSALSPGQKVKLLDAVRESGGSQDYESEGMAVFSVPRTALKDLDVRMKAMRIPVTRFGRLENEDVAPLSNAPVKISVYFSK